MDISQVPFAEHNGIVINSDGSLSMPFTRQTQNHFASAHAGAQFLLAESASGYLLLTHFPDLLGKVNPILRKSAITFVKQSQSELTARVKVSEQDLDKFLSSLLKRGRAVIELNVEVIDQQQDVTCTGTFKWLVTLSDSEKSSE
jgi:acyl-coenzyme A thioesterase PaaI-like protein